MTMALPHADLLAGLKQTLLHDRGNYPGRHIAEKILAQVGPRPETPEARMPDLDLIPIFAVARRSSAAHSASLSRIATELQAVFSHLAWNQRDSKDPSASPGFAHAHANAVIAGDGPTALWRCGGYAIGLSVAQPGTIFPLHNHAPEELYLTLTQADFKNAETGWQMLRTGQTFHNTPGIMHAMRSGNVPMVAIWLMGDH